MLFLCYHLSRNHQKGMESLPEQSFWWCFWNKQSTVAVLFPLALLWQRTEIGQGRVSTANGPAGYRVQDWVPTVAEGYVTAAWHVMWEVMTRNMGGNDMWHERRWHLTQGVMTRAVRGGATLSHTNSEFYIFRKTPHSFYHFPLSRAWKT